MRKWIFGIVAGILVAVGGWYLIDPKFGIIVPDKDCFFRGSVHSLDTEERPLSNVGISYATQNSSAVEIARTNPSGVFEVACPPRVAFPVTFRLSHADWGSVVFTGVSMGRDQTETVYNFYVDEEFAALTVIERIRFQDAREAVAPNYAPVLVRTERP